MTTGEHILSAIAAFLVVALSLSLFYLVMRRELHAPQECPHCDGTGSVTWGGEIVRGLVDFFGLLLLLLSIGLVCAKMAGVESIEVKVQSATTTHKEK